MEPNCFHDFFAWVDLHGQIVGVFRGGAPDTKILWNRIWSPQIEFESWSDAQYACEAAFSPSEARSSPRWGKLIIRRVRWSKLAIWSEIESAKGKLIHPELNETKSEMGQLSLSE